jgi:ketosteroid isomerase-like protein
MTGSDDPTVDPGLITPEMFVEAIRSGHRAEAIRAGYETFNAQGLDMSVFHPEAEWHQRPQLPDARTHRGHDEIVRFNDEFIGSFDGFRAVPLEVFEVVGKVVVVLRVSGALRGTEDRVEMEEVHVISFRDGLISEVHEYLTKDEALRSLGAADGSSAA